MSGFTHANRFRCAAFFRDFPRVGYLVNRMSPVFGQSTQLQSENRAKTYWRSRISHMELKDSNNAVPHTGERSRANIRKKKEMNRA